MQTPIIGPIGKYLMNTGIGPKQYWRPPLAAVRLPPASSIANQLAPAWARAVAQLSTLRNAAGWRHIPGRSRPVRDGFCQRVW
jgi:hypothetical protein